MKCNIGLTVISACSYIDFEMLLEIRFKTTLQSWFESVDLLMYFKSHCFERASEVTRCMTHLRYGPNQCQARCRGSLSFSSFCPTSLASFHLAANRKMSVVLPLYTSDYIDVVGLASSPTCAHSAAGNFGLAV